MTSRSRALTCATVLLALLSGPRAGAQGPTATPAGTTPAGTTPAGTTPAGTTPADTTPANRDAPRVPDAGGDSNPWGAASDVELPSFLDTTDTRVQDTRPPPTPEQIEALRLLEAEVGRFTNSGSTYRDTVVSLVRREYLRQRRSRDQWFARQIREEERLTNEARERAIALFERFIRRYPNDPNYTPDAMFRLGELYFERSAVQFQEQYDAATLARANGDETAMDALPTAPDLNPTVEIYQRIVRQFPDYRRIDGVFYLIGYCLNEMGRAEEARDAWLALVCANRYHYNPDQAAYRSGAGDAAEGADAATDAAAAHPSLQLGAAVVDVRTQVFVNPYAECTPVIPDARFVSETWFRIGEYHFDDYMDDFAVDKSIAAYNVILRDPTDRNYGLALYKVAWAYYRANRFEQAVRHFGMLVQWSDDQMAATGRAGSDLRPEAMQYMGITFAYGDWNDNMVPDLEEGGASGFQRLQNPQLLPQDREWTPDVYFATGEVFYEEAKYADAIQIWQYAINHWPHHRLVPHYIDRIATANRDMARRDLELSALVALRDYGPGSEWYSQNMDHPTELREAERLAEMSLIRAAVETHQTAQRTRQQCVVDRDIELCNEATTQYRAAAEAYASYLERYPNTQEAYELHFNLADALFWSGEYEQAATTYAEVRDSNLDDRHLHEAARMVVESIKRLIDEEVRAGRLSVRSDPPDAVGEPPVVRPVQMPMLLQRMAQARELFLARVDDRHDAERLRPAYDYNNAVLLYQYGYWRQAAERFQRIYDERCTGAQGAPEGRIAYQSLRNMALQLNNTDEVERLARDFQSRRCTFGADEAVDCEDPANREEPACTADNDLTAIEYRRAIAKFREAEAAPAGPQQIALYEEAAGMLVDAVDRNPGNPEAPKALIFAATALSRAGRPSSAQDLYRRVIRDVGDRRGADEGEQAELDKIMAEAFFRLAAAANIGFEFETALENYRILADSPRFAATTNEEVRTWREDALVNSAILLQNLGRYREATAYYTRVAQSTSDEAVRRNARYAIAEMAYNQRSYSDAVREYRSFISTYQRDAAAGELVVQSYWRIAQIRLALNQNNEYQAALADVVRAFSASGQEPGSMAAEYAANARFIIVDGGMAQMERYAMTFGRPATGAEFQARMRSEIERGVNLLTGLRDGYTTVPPYRRPTWTIAALVRTGRLYELLTRGILEAEVVAPADVQRLWRQLDRYDRESVQLEFEGTVRGVLATEVLPFECKAIANYALAARAGLAGNIDNEFTRIAADRLQAYGEERIGECIASEQANIQGLEAARPGEFARSPAGQVQSIPAGVSPPALVSE
ncbi:MAG: tetratricopeptide repeat protein [Sandaracinaceae bacterium]|nr:tetratricopeptide repeat protein [Sandaracinaceae bacterium]